MDLGQKFSHKTGLKFRNFPKTLFLKSCAIFEGKNTRTGKEGTERAAQLQKGKQEMKTTRTGKDIVMRKVHSAERRPDKEGAAVDHTHTHYHSLTLTVAPLTRDR